MDTIECKELIISTLSKRGAGVTGDPIRTITQVFEKDGRLVAEQDKYTYSVNDMVEFANWYMKQADTLSTTAMPSDIERWKGY